MEKRYCKMERWNEYEPIIIQKLNEIFKYEDYHSLSLYERRKKIYDYLYNSLEFDFEELNNNSRDIRKQIKDVLFNNKGICNSIIYAYKIMLEQVGVYSMVLFCKDEDDDHTIALVDNGDGTLSFDDISIAIYSKKSKGINASQEDRFDYDLEEAKGMQQGINRISGSEKYLLFPSEAVNNLFGKKDEYYKVIKPLFINEEDSFSKIATYIKSSKKQNIEFNIKTI